MLGNATGALLTGSLREWTGSYDISFSVAFVMCCIAFIVFHILEVVEHHMLSSSFHVAGKLLVMTRFLLLTFVAFWKDEPSPLSQTTRYKSELSIPLYREQSTYDTHEETTGKEPLLKRSTSAIAMIQRSKTFSSLVDRGVLGYSFDYLPNISVDNASDGYSSSSSEEEEEENDEEAENNKSMESKAE